MTRVATIHAVEGIEGLSAVSDPYVWQNQYGGFWSTAANWLDTITGTTAVSPPSASNAVSITGGTNSDFTDIVGTGTAAQLALNNDVLLYGSVAVLGTVTVGAVADFDLDGGASLGAGSLNLGGGSEIVAGGASTVTLTGAATLAAGFLTAIDGSIVQVGTLIANDINTGYAIEASGIAVDDTSSVEVGTTGGAALGAITIDPGNAAAVSGTLDGNVVVNGTLAVQGDDILTIDAGDPYGSARSISGAGTLLLSENSLLTLGLLDSAAIQFGGPGGILGLDVLPSGTISGFAAGDFIELTGGATVMATGLSYIQTSGTVATLTLTKGAVTVGTLTLAGNYTGSLFHLGLDTLGDGTISLQTIGSAPVQPSVIVGTAGSDSLIATVDNQTLTGLGGNDTLSAGGFTGIDFRDSSSDLNGSTITSFGTSDVIDLTDMALNTASVVYTPSAQAATIMVTDGTHTATIILALGAVLPPGNFVMGTDGAGGTDVTYNAANTDAYLFSATPGGLYPTAANWQDTTTGTVATQGPGYGNAVTFAGGTGASALGYIDVTGNGFAASVAASGDVLLWGSVVAGSKLAGVSGALAQSGILALDGAADLVLGGTATVGGLIEVGGGSTLTAAGGVSFSSNAASLLATGGSSIEFPTLHSSSVVSGTSQYDTSVIGIDPTSTIEVGNAGSAAAGALTIDHGLTVDLGGSVDGNLVVNGTLIVAGTLDVAAFGSVAPSVSGGGLLELTYGDTLGLGGSDTVAILFSQSAPGNYSIATETLALGNSMPTATISGLTKGDVITVGLTVTNVVWNGATLTLLDGATTVGKLLLSGVYATGQFQVQLSPNGLSSTITYAATPSTAGGNSVTGTSDAYTWNDVSGGVWNNAGQWTDTTQGGTPTAAPGANNAVTVNDNPGSWTPQIIYGPASAASLTINGPAVTILDGSFAIGGLFSVATSGTASADVALYGGSNLAAGSLSVTSLLRVASASLLSVLGSGSGTFISGDLTVESDSAVTVESGANVITGVVAVDGTSEMEFGTAGTATAGSLALDYGQALTLQGVAAIDAKVVVNGTLTVYSGSIGGFAGSVGTVSGTGTIDLGALGSSGYLVLDASDTVPIVFEGYSVGGIGYAFEDLELRSPLRTGNITGFLAGDTIIVDRGVTGAAFVQTTNAQGTLTLSDGGAVVGTLTLNGNYAASLFQVDLAGQTGVATISLQAASGAPGTAAANTGSHAYSWTGASGGNWMTAANWEDTTTATTPTTVPGSGNAVTIGGNIGANQYTTVGGTGAALNLMITGHVLLTGQVAVAGSVNVSIGSGPTADLTLQAGAVLTAGGSVVVFGRFEAGGGSAATFPGYAVLYGGSLLALNGSTVQAGGLIGDGSGDVVAVDASSILKIGASTSASVGAMTVAAGAPTEFTGLIYGSVVDNGTLSVQAAGTLLIDMTATAEADPYETNPTISGTGTLSLTEGSTLGLGVADSATIQFTGPNSTLLLAAIPTGTIKGFVPGDQIQVEQIVTGLAYAQVSGTAATLTLTNGASTVGVLKLAGAFGGGTAFHLDAAANGSMAVITSQSLLVAATQPTLIHGTYGSDSLVATANGQTLTGNGGGDIISAGAFTGIDFRDYSFYLSGSEILDFGPTDMIDLIDVNPATATQTYTAGVLSVTDGTHAASISLSFAAPTLTGSFHIASDGASGSKLTWA